MIFTAICILGFVFVCVVCRLHCDTNHAGEMPASADLADGRGRMTRSCM